MRIRPLEETDWPSVSTIYQQGIDGSQATFETDVPDWVRWNMSHHRHSRFVASTEGQVVGWVALSPVSSRKAYKGVAEISIYIHKDYRGKGIAGSLMKRVIESSELSCIWTLTATMFVENKASIHLHEKHGFRKVGFREKIAQLDGTWRDTVIYEWRNPSIQ